MTLSAKWTSLSILAIAALGAVACTVTSGTVDDSNGGTGSNTDVDSGDTETPDSGTDSSTTNPDATASTCEDNKQANALVSLECQACLEQNCCAELKGCFNIDPGTDDAGTPNVSCTDYVQCVTTCNTDSTTQEEADACVKDTCRVAAGDTIANSFDAILTCGATKGCGATCGIE